MFKNTSFNDSKTLNQLNAIQIFNRFGESEKKMLSQNQR